MGNVSFYEHINYKGWKKELIIGNYPWTPKDSIPNDQISSIKVPRGLYLTIYEHSNYRGRSTGYLGPMEIPNLLRSNWNDKISSLKITEAPVFFYEHINYGGWKKELRPGNYPWIPKNSIPNDQISSIKVPKGLVLTVYEHANYKGWVGSWSGMNIPY
jgi:hypothetical protein